MGHEDVVLLVLFTVVFSLTVHKNLMDAPSLQSTSPMAPSPYPPLQCPSAPARRCAPTVSGLSACQGWPA